MSAKKLFCIFSSILFCFSLRAIEAQPGASAKPVIAVSILPQAYFVSRIAGERVSVVTIVGTGQNPHSYEPSPRQMADIGNASLWFTINIEFEKALEPKIASIFPRLQIVDTTRDVIYREFEANNVDEDESGKDPHIWLGSQAVRAQSEVIRDALIRLDPNGKAQYIKGFEDFMMDLEATFSALSRDLLPLRGRTVFVYHPSFGYFFDEFGIIQTAVETGGKEPTQKGLAALVAKAKREGARTIFVQAQFPTAAAGSLARAIGGVVVPIDPLAEDWLANLKRIGAALHETIGR